MRTLSESQQRKVETRSHFTLLSKDDTQHHRLHNSRCRPVSPRPASTAATSPPVTDAVRTPISTSPDPPCRAHHQAILAPDLSICAPLLSLCLNWHSGIGQGEQTWSEKGRRLNGTRIPFRLHSEPFTNNSAVGKHRKHPGGRGLAGGQHHHRTNMDKVCLRSTAKHGTKTDATNLVPSRLFRKGRHALLPQARPTVLEACHQPRQALVPRPPRAA